MSQVKKQPTQPKVKKTLKNKIAKTETLRNPSPQPPLHLEQPPKSPKKKLRKSPSPTRNIIHEGNVKSNLKTITNKPTGAVPVSLVKIKEKDEVPNISPIIDKHKNTPKMIVPPNSREDLNTKRKITKSPTKTKPLKPIKEEPKVDPTEKYPILKNHELVKKFLGVTMTNNQKGRIRQVLRDIFKGTPPVALPDVINNRIQNILYSSENLTDADLRNLRVLYNMLKKATQNQNVSVDAETEPIETGADGKKVKKKPDKKSTAKGVKRYVLFIGNLPPNVTKDQILEHFWELRESIKDVRIPKRSPMAKSAIAYIELGNEPSYELALSKHHSMMGKRRIRIQYTTQKNGKITKAQAKSKTAKLEALVKAGKLLGSIPVNKKRSARRAKAKRAQKLQEESAQKSFKLSK